MTSVDGYLTPVRRDLREAYTAFSNRVAAVYLDHGALRVVDCWPDDRTQEQASFHAEDARDALDPGDAVDQAPRTFPDVVGVRQGEVVVVSWVEWPDRATRNTGLDAALADPRVQPRPDEPRLFEGRRLIAGGFTAIVDQTARRP